MSEKSISVFKIGGSVLDTKESVNKLLDSIRDVLVPGSSVIVHGGGNHISSLLARLDKEAVFIQGQRYTDDETMQVVEMVLSGTLNKEIVAYLNSAGITSIGISGRDSGLAIAENTNEKLGRVGEVSFVDPKIIFDLMKNKVLPVLSPVCSDPDGNAINVNADLFAWKIAAALEAENLNFVTDTGGVLKNDALLDSISADEVEKLISDEVVTAGMIPKLRSAVYAVQNGVVKVNIMDYNGKTGTVIS